MSAPKQYKCSHRAIVNVPGREGEPQVCFKHASQRIVMRARIVFRCPDHELNVELCESHGWSVWKVEAA